MENNTVTIPDAQIITETKYGNYRYVKLSNTGSAQAGDNVGAINNGEMQFNSLAAMIVAGGNAGLFHWACMGITIK